jgi:hypothetical protein
MKKEIVYTEEYALILNDERIEDVRPHKGKFHLEQGLIINQFPTYLTDLTECKLIIAHLPLSDAPILEGVPLLPPFSWNIQDDVEKIAPTHFECEMVQLSSNESFGLDYGSSNLKPKTITNSQGQVELVGKYI